GGYKDYTIDIDSFKLGETPLIDFSRTKNIQQILLGADPVIKLEILQNGENSNIYPRCVHEDALNAPLKKEIDGTDNNKIPGEIIRTTPNNTDRINVDIFFHSGLGMYNDDGDLVSASVEVRAWYKSADDPDSAYQLLGNFNGSSNVISFAELKTRRFQITREGLTKGQYTIKIERITTDSSDAKVIDQVHIGSIRSFKSKRPIKAERQKDLTIIALRVMATAKLNGVIDSFNYIARSKLPIYSKIGTGPLYWLNVTETRNPAAMLLYALRGRAAQQVVEPDDLDWQAIEAFYIWCEEHDYSCNAYLSESVTIAELIRMIGSTARADILRIDSKISIVQDIERPTHMQLFTPKNTINYSVTMFKADIPDAISLRYIDEDAGFAQNELTVYNTPDGNFIKEPETTQKVDLWGITNSKQVRKIGMYNYACLKNRPFVHSIDVDIEYLIVNKGDWIQYAGDVALTGSVQGRIKGIIIVDGVCVGIDTDEPVVMTEGRQHAVRIRLSNGTIIMKDVVYNPGIRREKSITYFPSEDVEKLYEPFIGEMKAIDEDNVYYEPLNIILFTELIDLKNAPKPGDIYAFGVRGYEALDLIIIDIQPGQNLSASLTCVEYSPEIFKVDSPDFILPEFENKITPVSGAVDSGVVNTNNWRSFAVFHDSEEEPPTPVDDGQDEGWHLVQTFRSIWQSTKIAESIDSGAWGSPVRIKAQRGTEDITPIWLALTPQNIVLETDGDGNILASLLPLTVQARLLQWNSLLSDVTFSLPAAPAGINIDENGLITVDADAELTDVNNITVRAGYKGGVYSSTLSITKNLNSYAPRYLGTVNALDETATVLIIKGPVQGQVQARQGDYVLAIALVNNRSPGSVFQWTGIAWEFRSPDTHADLYMRCFKDGLD
ncbi:MAG: host specificity factor TipJ family phage tail protein, partial [Treponema sp.]|nr:host specificity factor TipJ family phage tail protein [Treponema sp.]